MRPPAERTRIAVVQPEGWIRLRIDDDLDDRIVELSAVIARSAEPARRDLARAQLRHSLRELAAATVAALATLVIHASMMLAGSHRVNGWDLVFDTVALIPFGGSVVKALRGGTRLFPAIVSAAGGGTATRGVLNVGRNAVEDGLRTIAGAGGVNGGQVARAARAGGIADRFLSESFGSSGRSAWNAIRAGGARLDVVLLSMSERVGTAWPTSGSARAVATQWAQKAGTATGMQGVNVFNFGYGLEQSASILAEPFGIDIPTLSDLPGLDNPLARPL